MAHESFEDAATARLMNEVCVPVKVDREERPDVDAVYMAATQAITGQGGWPMTVFCTPEGEPFFCGTYFPREHFQRLLRAIESAWRDKREELREQGNKVVEAIGGVTRPVPGNPLTPDMLAAAVSRLGTEYDQARGGFGGAPKFPPSSVLEFLLRHHHRTGSESALSMVDGTAEAMARGGMYDQLGGGFARYAVDATWTVPHFEKMLYDNALLLRAYTNLWRANGSELTAKVADETARFLLDDLRTPEGGFASSLDADTEGEEGLTYVWTPAQLIDLLGPEDGRWAAEMFAVTESGTFEKGTSVLQLPRDPDDQERFGRVRETLSQARKGRPQPGRDDKVVAAWNGMVICALAEYGRIRSNQQAVDAATAAAELLWTKHLVDGRLRRVSRDGAVGAHAGVLEDYAAFAEACTVLVQVTGDAIWLERAGFLLDEVLTRFTDGDGGFYDTADDAQALVFRPMELSDGATPSGSSLTAGALVAYAALTGSTRHREAAEVALAKVGAVVAQMPRFAGWAAAVGEALAAGPYEIAVVGDGPDAEALADTAWAAGSPGAVIVTGQPDADGLPLLADRPLVDGKPAAYLCRGFVCDLPRTEASQVTNALW